MKFTIRFLTFVITLFSMNAIAWQDKDAKIPSMAERKKMLTSLQYEVTQENGTETPFQNEFFDNEKEGIYVDVVSGAPLFSSRDKFDSHTGWPSFAHPLVKDNVIEGDDHGATEVHSKYVHSHLGHVFNDGPASMGGLRYCIDSAALRFIPKEELKDPRNSKYKEFLTTAFEKKK